MVNEMKRKTAKLVLNLGLLSSFILWTIFGILWINNLIPIEFLGFIFIGCGGGLAIWIALWIFVPVAWAGQDIQ